MRYYHLFFCFVFVVFAALQYNDPDPYVWIPIYGYAAVLCFEASRKHYYPKAYLIGIAIYLLYAVYKIFDRNGVIDWLELHHAESLVESMKAEKPWIEETREFGGLMILIVVLLINYFIARRVMKKAA